MKLSYWKNHEPISDGEVQDHFACDRYDRTDVRTKRSSPSNSFSNDLISSARGNTSLESAVSLTKSLRWEIQNLGQRLAAAASAEESMQRKGPKSYDKAQHEKELKQIILAIRKLLSRIEDAVPLINLAITASGASLSSTLPSTVSTSRLLQASTFLTAGDSQYGVSSSRFVQIGPTFTLSMYMLFMGHSRPQDEEEIRESTWKEVMHKADVRLMRVPIGSLYSMPGTGEQGEPLQQNEDDLSSSEPELSNGSYTHGHMEAEVRSDEYAYQLVIVEDLEDDRVHEFGDDESQPGPYLDVSMAGIREIVPIHELSKIFYADTGKILNIGGEGEANSPVLLLKRDPNAQPPRRLMDRYDNDEQDWDNHDPNGVVASVKKSHHDDSQAFVSSQVHPQSSKIIRASDPWRLPPDLDPEWIAFEVYTEAEESDVESDSEAASTKSARPSRAPSLDPAMTSALSRLSVNTPSPSSPSSAPLPSSTPQKQQNYPPTLPPIRTSLSLLETLLRLLSLQQFEQQPHLSISDEMLAFFLSESATTGAANNDAQERKRLREEARRRVGFDPYDESPVKRRGEDYQYRGSERTPPPWNGSFAGDRSHEGYGSPMAYESSQYEDEGYDTRNWSYPSHNRPPSTSRDVTPETAPLLLENRSRNGTPGNSPISPGGRYAPPRRWTDSRSGLRQTPADAGRRGSPLARPGTGVTDEGLGSSPVSLHAEKGE